VNALVFRKQVTAALFMSAALLTAPSALGQASTPVGDPVHSLDVEHIALDLRFNTQKKIAFGSARIKLSPKRPATSIILDSAGLDIESVELIGRGPVPFELTNAHEDGGIIIDLGKTYEPSDQIELDIGYKTTLTNETDPGNIWSSVGKGLRFLAPSLTDPRRRVQIWSSNQPGSNRSWFPSYDHPDDLRTFELTATVDGGLTVVSNGTLISEIQNKDGSHKFHWRLEQPQQNHRSSITIGVFENVKLRSKLLTLNNYGYPDEADGVEASVDRLADIAAFMMLTIDRPFPFPEYSQVFVQGLPWGMANSGVATLTENFVDSKEVHRDFLYLWDGLQAESLAEQWFGNAVAPATWEDSWIARGLPRYLTALYNEHRNGEAEVLLSPYHVPSNLRVLLFDWNNGVRQEIVPSHVEDPAAFILSNASSIRAGVALRILEGEIGRPALLRTIRKFARNKAGELATTDDFEFLVSRSAGRDMGWFFDQWFRRASHPALTVNQYFDPDQRLEVVTIDQEPADKEDLEKNEIVYFGGAMEIEIDGNVKRVILKPQARNVYKFSRRNPPRFVNVDYKSRWLADITFSRTALELIALAKSSSDILARRNAMIELGAIALDEETAVGTHDAIIALYRNTMEGDEYWRLKIVALIQLRRVLSKAGSAPKAGLDDATEAALVRIAKGDVRDEAWVRFSALAWLGEARDKRYTGLFLSLLRDPSDRVINAAAIALGKTRDERAFDALVTLEPHPSWKNQSRISMLNGLAELGDVRGEKLAIRALEDLNGARWTLLTPVWDYRLAAAHALRRLARSGNGYLFVRGMFDQALAEGHINDSIYNLHLMVALADPRARGAVAAMRDKYREDQAMMNAIDNINTQLEAALDAT